MRRPTTGTFMAPVARAYQEAGNWDGRVAGIVGTVFQFMWSDFFVWALVILLVSHVYDWLYGRLIAKANDEFDQVKSTLGLHSKIASVVIVFLVRLMEFAALNAGLVNTQGILAAGITMLLVVEDIHSIEAKRIRSGAGPIPMLSKALNVVEKALEKWMPTEPEKEDTDGG